jgi:hypothetical protein
MYLNVTDVWLKTADVAWGNNGAMDQSLCIGGATQDETSTSTSTNTSQSGSTNPQNSQHSKGAGVTLMPRVDAALLGCGVVVIVSLLFGGSMIV